MIKFIETYGKIILITLSAIVVAIIVFVIIAETQGNNKEAALSQLEELEELMSEDDSALSLAEFDTRAAEIARRSRDNYIQNRIAFLAALVRWENGEYQDAAERYLRLAEKSPATHLGQIAFFNAAMSREQGGDTAEAIAILERTLTEYEFSVNPLLPRVLLNLGRLYETQGDTMRAIEYYNTLIQEYSGNELINLAYNRLILIESAN